MSSSKLLISAVKLNIPRLVQICEDYIGQTLTPEKVAEVLNLAVDVKSERLDSCCSDFIAAHVNNVMATKTLNNLRPQALKNLITRSVIPASSLLCPPTPQRDQPVTGFNSDFENDGDSLYQPNEHTEEMKDPMGSYTPPPLSNSGEETGVTVEKSAENLDKAKEMNGVGLPTGKDIKDITGKDAKDIAGLVKDHARTKIPSGIMKELNVRVPAVAL